ncbi:hypothetical protein V7S43_002361 [Phytophthora oleae]|uniref:Uncharacterized protein n=1 Tax=Phytophthora oleae TaxID=2107226 RepID=A0ABD3G3B3_9STRA
MELTFAHEVDKLDAKVPGIEEVDQQIFVTECVEPLSCMNFQPDPLSEEVFGLGPRSGILREDPPLDQVVALQQEEICLLRERVLALEIALGLGDGGRAAAVSGRPGAQPRVASLSKCPKDLYELWHEFEFGLNEAKEAKHFTAAECFTSEVAIDKVYAAYGRQRSATSILV